ncbi:MAG TPA: DUF3618 domain-containing protein [Nocardioidaceae bacterium]|jgi:ElaB/YqjD/DUF883 family membrane-anchored ribosome-binding protein
MTTPTDPTTAAPTPEPDKNATADEIAADIERTREHLGETVDALARKADVKAQAAARVDEAKVRAREQAQHVAAVGQRVATKAKESATDDEGHVKPAFPVGVASAAVLFVFAWLIWRRRRS